MIYKTTIGDINLKELTRIYPAVLIKAGGETAEMSLEWIESYSDRVEVLEYILVFDKTKPGNDKRDKMILSFETKDELLDELRRLDEFISNQH